MILDFAWNHAKSNLSFACKKHKQNSQCASWYSVYADLSGTVSTIKLKELRHIAFDISVFTPLRYIICCLVWYIEIRKSPSFVVLCMRQRPSWTYPPQVFTSVHLFNKIVRSRFTISSPLFKNNWVQDSPPRK